MQEVPAKSEVAKREEETLAFWKREQIFQKTLEKKAPKGDFVFYEGPPTANGKPGIHHLESRAYKDLIPRYKTMRGYRVLRRAGWDTHGLPVELEVEKELGFTGKQDIERYGIAAFNQKCRESVLRYIDLWAKFTERIGYWVDSTKAYFTYDAPYMEVLWNVFAHAAKDGRLYKDFRIVPWCPRDQTALSSHELAQGYADVKDISVTAKFELIDRPGTYLLAWTTTPWTLLGNVALAVGSEIEYGAYDKDGVRVIVADARAKSVLGDEWTRAESIAARDLIGKRYRPLYEYARALAPESEKEKFANAYTVYAADFVTTEEGTGIVHTAVMYGQDDFVLGGKLGLPKMHLVDPEGRFITGTGSFAGMSVIEEGTTVEIVKDLASRGLLFSKEKYEHTYPFCWRCKTRLIYYARDSWYLRMTDLRERLVAANKTVAWEPAHIREGRMGEWLENVKDWAISRERYWGTPLPIWQSKDGMEQLVIGSVDELRAHAVSAGNTYLIMRHGEADHNVLGICSSDSEKQKGHHLTARGREQVRASAEHLKGEGIDLLFTSPFVRAQESAKIVAEVLGLTSEQIRTDDRLREISVGEFEGRNVEEYHTLGSPEVRFWKAPKGGESGNDVRKRVGDFLYELEKTYAGKRILILAHGDPLWIMQLVAASASASAITDYTEPATAEIRTLTFVPLPHNENFELDLHRPFIDDVVLRSTQGTELRRVKEVMDVWFDSGAMPFAQAANERGETPLDAFVRAQPYPADYISEAIDQTRGWFYTLLAVGALMGKEAPYRNVICLGHLLDAKGLKMSKSKGNIVEPFAEFEKWGVDALRLWMYSVSAPGDSKNYDEKTVREAAKALSWLENSAKFYTLFKDVPQKSGTGTVLDRWVRVRLAETIETVTSALDAYQPFEASRALMKFSEDLSQWYVRRARDRMREGDAVAIATLRDVLHATSRLLAPFAPFLAEHLYQQVRRKTDPISVHLCEWPRARPFPLRLSFARGTDLIKHMARVRELASTVLKMRQEHGLKVRQPLASLSITDALPQDFAAMLAEEVNVKTVNVSQPELKLDVELTPSLIKEGDDREMARAVAEARKQEKLLPSDKAHVHIDESGVYTVELSTGTTRFNLIRDAS